jgi:predicted GNAT family N-acyltransferase
MEIKVLKIFEPDVLEQAFKIRREVFVIEQQVDENEEYEFEDESTHFIALVNGEYAGTARWRVTEKGVKLERFAVKKDFRSIGVGSYLLSTVINDIPTEHHYLYLHAQITAMGLYSKYNFIAEGELFEEAGIQHYKMVLKR